MKKFCSKTPKTLANELNRPVYKCEKVFRKKLTLYYGILTMTKLKCYISYTIKLHCNEERFCAGNKKSSPKYF